MSSLSDLLRYVAETGSSELHIAAGQVPRMRQQQDLMPLQGWPALSEEELRALMASSSTLPRGWSIFESGEANEVQFALELRGLPRFSIVALRSSSGSALVFKLISDEAKGAEP